MLNFFAAWCHSHNGLFSDDFLWITLHCCILREDTRNKIMCPAFIDRETQVDTAASGAVVAVWVGREILVDSIVTMDETWVHCSTLDSKYYSIQCLHPGSPKPKKTKTMFSAWKVMAIICWDSKGILYMDFLTGHRTINTECYPELPEGPVKTAVRNKRKEHKHQCHFPRITPVYTWLLAPWTPYIKWNGTFFHILHIVRNLLPQAITSSAP